MGPNGITTAYASDGKDARARIDDYAESYTAVTASIAFADSMHGALNQGYEMVKTMIVDDGR